MVSLGEQAQNSIFGACTVSWLGGFRDGELTVSPVSWCCMHLGNDTIMRSPMADRYGSLTAPKRQNAVWAVPFGGCFVGLHSSNSAKSLCAPAEGTTLLSQAISRTSFGMLQISARGVPC